MGCMVVYNIEIHFPDNISGKKINKIVHVYYRGNFAVIYKTGHVLYSCECVTKCATTTTY